MKPKIEVIPIIDNLLLVAGDIIRCLYQMDIDTKKVKQIENRIVGTFKSYPLHKSIQILNIFTKILDTENIILINGITHKKGFNIRDIGKYQNSIKRIETQ